MHWFKTFFYFTELSGRCRVKTYPCLEMNHYIYIWCHNRGRLSRASVADYRIICIYAGLEPTWFPESIEEINSGKWAYHGRTEHIVNCKIDVSTFRLSV